MLTRERMVNAINITLDDGFHNGKISARWVDRLKTVVEFAEDAGHPAVRAAGLRLAAAIESWYQGHEDVGLKAHDSAALADTLKSIRDEVANSDPVSK